MFAWTKIVRHKMVMGTASPDDPALDWYWASRRRKAHAQLGWKAEYAMPDVVRLMMEREGRGWDG